MRGLPRRFGRFEQPTDDAASGRLSGWGWLDLGEVVAGLTLGVEEADHIVILADPAACWDDESGLGHTKLDDLCVAE